MATHQKMAQEITPVYRFEKLESETVSDLIPIYQQAFGICITSDKLRLKQDTSVFGPSFVGYIAYAENNEPAAFYGVFPCLLEYKGQKYLVAQSGDTMTHPAHTGKGLFTQLALKTYEYCKENGIHLVFGFPNQNSYPGFVKKLGWVHFDDMEVYTIRAPGFSWYRIRKYLKLSDALHKRRGNRILNKQKPGKPFTSSCQSEDVPVIDHSADFFKYKTYEKNYLLNIEGLNVWLKFDTDFLYVGDIEKSSEEKTLRVIRALKSLARRMFIPHIRFQGSTGTPLSQFFAKHGQKMEAKHPIGGVHFGHEIPLEKIKFTMADNDTF